MTSPGQWVVCVVQSKTFRHFEKFVYLVRTYMWTGKGSLRLAKMEGNPETEQEAVANLTADEAEQYDRQIRLWGLEAQKR